MWLTKLQIRYILEANNKKNSHPLEVLKNKLLNNFKCFDKAETRVKYFQGKPLSEHRKPVTTIPTDRYRKM
jgi:hypothetical protein